MDRKRKKTNRTGGASRHWKLETDRQINHWTNYLLSVYSKINSEKFKLF